jgi:group I intron endonuclease
MIIYKTTNLINGKFYIGFDTKNNSKYLGSGLHLKRAIKKYGRENFAKVILEICSSLEELSKREIYWIEKTKAVKLGYNISKGGKGGNKNHTDKTKEKISKTRKQKKIIPWNKGKKGLQVAWNKGLTKDIDERIKEYAKKISGKNHGMYGKHHTEESKQKISKNSCMKKPEHQKRQSDFMKNNNPMFNPDVVKRSVATRQNKE